MEQKDVLEKFKNAIVDLDLEKALDSTKEALNNGVTPYEIMDAMRSASNLVGQKFESCEYFISELIIAGTIMKSASDLLKPHMSGDKTKFRGKVIIGSAPGDMHDIGKNLVGMMLEGTGFEVVDLGIDVPVNKFVDAVKQYRPRFLAMSALLTTTMAQMKMVIEELEGAGLRQTVNVMVGGAPLNQGFADEIGADGFGVNAGQAAELMKRMLN